jgi:3-deoxy-D-manno-octulosonic-acid transferase
MHPSFLSYLKEKCPGKVTFWSKEIDYRADTLVVDKVGFLSRAYAYADVAWVGGGFDKGLHNILEAAAWGKPVLHGPKTAHFPEAVRIDTAGGGFSITTESDAVTALTHLQQPENLQIASQAARQFVEAQAGATARILAEVEKTA